MDNSEREKKVPNLSSESGKDKVDEETVQTQQVMDDMSQRKDEEKSQVGNESDSDDSDIDLDSAFRCEICNKTFSGLKPLLQHEKSGKHHKKILQKKVGKKVSKELEDDEVESLEDLLTTGEPFANCDTCRKQFSGPESFHQHLKSKIHHKKVAEIKLLEKVTEDGKINVEKLKEICKQKRRPRKELSATEAIGYSPTNDESESDDSDNDLFADSHQFECTECEKVFTGVNSWYQHLVSKSHEKTLKQKEMLEKLTSKFAIASSKDLESIDIEEDVLTCRMCHKSFSGPESAAAHMKSRGHAKKLEIQAWKISHSVKSAARSPKEGKAPKAKNDNQTTNPPSTVESEENKAHSVESSNNLVATKNPENRSKDTDDAKCGSDLSEALKNPGSASSAASVVAGEVTDSKKEDIRNTLLSYESYKEYKKIMNEINPEKN